MNNFIFWDTTPCCPFKLNRHFEGRRSLHLQDPKQEPSMKRATAKQNSPFHFLPCHIFWSWGLRRNSARNISWLSPHYTASYPRRQNSTLYSFIKPPWNKRFHMSTIFMPYYNARFYVSFKKFYYKSAPTWQNKYSETTRICRFYRVNLQNYCVLGLFPSTCSVENRKLNDGKSRKTQ
jgi:hypothetical protein